MTTLQQTRLHRCPSIVLLLWFCCMSGFACTATIEKSDSKLNDVCKLTPVERDRKMIIVVLDELIVSYDWGGGGGISEIKQLATNTFRGSIAQDERVDLTTYTLEINHACEVTIIKKEIGAYSYIPRDK